MASPTYQFRQTFARKVTSTGRYAMWIVKVDAICPRA